MLGNENSSSHIYVNGNRIAITQNLYDALVELRHREYSLVWVDMLCIDQRNSLEQAVQIQQMTLTYSRAYKVVAWLGKEDEDFLEISRILKQLLEFRESVGPECKVLDRSDLLWYLVYMWLKAISADLETLPLYRRLKTRSPVAAKLLRKVNKEFSEGDEILAEHQAYFLQRLNGVVRREYWQRAWILQEITVADSLEVICGPYNLDFDIFAQILVEMSRLHERNFISGFNESHEHIVNLSSLRDKWRPREPIYLLEALSKRLILELPKKKTRYILCLEFALT